MPPGRATNASERSNISRLRSCMSGVTTISWTRSARSPRPEKLRDDSGDRAAVVEHGSRHSAHHADRSAAIDEPDAVFGEDLTERFGGFDKAGIGAGAGAAIDTDSFDLFMSLMWHRSVKRQTWRFAGAAELAGKSPKRKILLSRLYGSGSNALYDSRYADHQKTSAANGAPDCSGATDGPSRFAPAPRRASGNSADRRP